MFDKLKVLKNNSYSPFSNYKTACIVKMKDGTIFEGVNVENPSFKDGLCAEQVAIGASIANRYKKGDFEALYLLGSSDHQITPCFLCRQLLLEFFEMNDKIISYDLKGIEKVFTVKELCPYTFSGKDLNND